jgi:hypothetical protein
LRIARERRGTIPTKFKGSKADRLVQRKKREQLLESMPAIMMEDVELDKVICAKYLGHLFTGDEDCSEDFDSRMQKARRRFNKMKWLWQDSDLGLVYGSESTDRRRGV